MGYTEKKFSHTIGGNMRVLHKCNTESHKLNHLRSQSRSDLVFDRKFFGDQLNHVGTEFESQVLQSINGRTENFEILENPRNKFKNESQNCSVKTSFCIDSLLNQTCDGKAQRSDNSNEGAILLSTEMNYSNLNIILMERQNQKSESKALVDDYTKNIEQNHILYPNFKEKAASGIEQFTVESDPNEKLIRKTSSNKDVYCSIDKSILSTSDFEVNRKMCASPDSFDSRSLTNSPFSLKSEDQACTLPNSERKVRSMYDRNKMNGYEQNQNSILESDYSLTQSGNIFYHSSRESAFYTIHKEREYEKHLETTTYKSQQHLHSLQLEWLAQSGILYPRFSTDFSGKVIFYVNQNLYLYITS